MGKLLKKYKPKYTTGFKVVRFAPTQDGLGLQNTKHHMCGTTMCQIWLLFFFSCISLRKMCPYSE